MARIGIVIYSLAGGGAEKVSVNLGNTFNELGHKVDFILAKQEGELLSELQTDINIFAPKQASAREWKETIQSYSEEQKPDVVLAMMEGAGILSIQACRKQRTKVFVVSHNHFTRHTSKSKRLKERILMPLAAKIYLRKADGIIGVSKGVSDEIRSVSGIIKTKVHTIYNPILNDDFYTKLHAPVSHDMLIEDRDWLTVITVGRLTKQKAHEVLLSAIQEISVKQKVKLLIFGQGERLAELKALAHRMGISEFVSFEGFSSNPFAYIKKSDVFVLSSSWEGFGNVLVEALASGVSVVSTDCYSGPSEILLNGKFGQLTPVGDTHKMAESIIKAKNFHMDKTALKLHLEQFETNSIAKKYLNVMELGQ